MNFKENWSKKDELCPHCNQVTKRVKGITKQNIKRLLIPRFDFNEMFITFMLIAIIALCLLYNSETKICREWVAPMRAGDVNHCISVCSEKCRVVTLTGVDSIAQSSEINLTYDMNELNNTFIP